jgi:hypothetical protein
MKSSKLVAVRGLDLHVKTENKPPALSPLHKHTAKGVSANKSSTTRLTIRQELSARMRKTGSSPARSDDM